MPVQILATACSFPETYQFAHSFIEDWELDIRVFNPAITAARQKALYGNLWEQGEEGNKKYALLIRMCVFWIHGKRGVIFNGSQNASWAFLDRL